MTGIEPEYLYKHVVLSYARIPIPAHPVNRQGEIRTHSVYLVGHGFTDRLLLHLHTCRYIIMQAIGIEPT